MEKRYNSPVPDSWFASFRLCPSYLGKELTFCERKKAIDWIKNNHPECKDNIVNFIAENAEILEEEFKKCSEKRINFLKYNITVGNMPQHLGQVALTFEKLYPSSAALERVLSTMGFIEDDLRHPVFLQP